MMGSRAWIAAALDCIARDGCVVLATQCVVEGSTPRETGVKMLVTQRDLHGTIGGGALEYQVIQQARALLGRPDRDSVLQDYPLGPLLAQCCGGHARLLLERLDADDLGWLRALAAEAADHDIWLETRLGPGAPRKRRLREPPAGSSADAFFLDSGRTPLPAIRPPRERCAFLIERLPAPPPLLRVYGAGHVGQAIIRVMSVTDSAIEWFDARESYLADSGAIPIRPIDDIGALAASAPRGAMHVVLTHSHELDYALVRAVLSQHGFRYCGLIGSKTKRTRFRRRLLEDGAPPAAVDRLTCPIGLAGLRGKSPGVIAVALACQLIALTEAAGVDAEPSPISIPN